MNSLFTYCPGESHIRVNKPCQDYAYSFTERGVSIAIVCDGHGGDRYFRSDVGAKYATEITFQKVNELLDNMGSIREHLSKSAFIQVEALTTQRSKGNFDKESVIDIFFKQLFKSIIAGWHSAIEEYSLAHPLTDKERESISEKYILDYTHNVEKTYGCTLMAAVVSRSFWFAFHIGDGKCISFDSSGSWTEPIPWDDRCFLNKTTSLCDSDAIDEFRYCYGGKSSIPIAIFLGSDGIDDSFGETENMVNFYIQIAKLICSQENGKDLAIASLEEDLPKLSMMGSKDDMSIASIFEPKKIKKALPNLLRWQIDRLEYKRVHINELLNSAIIKKEQLEAIKQMSQQDTIEYQYSISDIDKYRHQVLVLDNQIRKLKEEEY